MALQDKYAELVSAAQAQGVSDLQVREQDGVLYVDGVAPSEAAKDAVWNVYNKIDPDFRAGDAVVNITVAEGAAPSYTEYVVKSGDSLSKIGAAVGKNWKEIYEANKDVIGDNPDLIQVGWKLKIPS